MLTADGADGSHVFVAMRKALTALAFKAPSADVDTILAKHPAQLSLIKPNMFVMGGALPILVHGSVIGAVGVSGAAGVPFGRQDDLCARAALPTFGAVKDTFGAARDTFGAAKE